MNKLIKVLFSWEQWYQENYILLTLIKKVAIKIILCYTKAAEQKIHKLKKTEFEPLLHSKCVLNKHMQWIDNNVCSPKCVQRGSYVSS